MAKALLGMSELERERTNVIRQMVQKQLRHLEAGADGDMRRITRLVGDL